MQSSRLAAARPGIRSGGASRLPRPSVSAEKSSEEADSKASVAGDTKAWRSDLAAVTARRASGRGPVVCANAGATYCRSSGEGRGRRRATALG